MRTYIDRREAASALLSEAVRVAGSSVPFVVVGGWSPFLLCEHRGLHPGTLDVDLLFEGGSTPEALSKVFGAFLSAGYIRSAKHEFQLLKPFSISGSDYMFNVDFLHPAETVEDFELFVKQVEWPEYTDRARQKHFTSKSIALPSAQLVFDHSLYVDHPHEIKEQVTNVRLVSPVGIFVTKAKSYTKAKRLRDAYDLYLAASEIASDPKEKETFKKLRAVSDEADAVFITMAEDLSGFPKKFDCNVKKYDSGIESPSDDVLSILAETERP